MAARREARFRAARERSGHAAAVGLVADDEHELAARGRGVADVGRRRSRREALVDLRIAQPEGGRGLARAQQGAREDGVRPEPVPAQLLAERPGLLAALGCEGAQLVGGSGRGLGVTDDQEAHRNRQDRRGRSTAPPVTFSAMTTKLAGAGAAAVALALTAGLAFDAGGFHPVSWDRALVGVAGLTLVTVLLAGARRPGRAAAATLGALGLLTAWTAASWAWSDSPPAALQEAQRTALYAAVAAAVVVAGRRIGPGWIAAGVAAGACAAGIWNLCVRLAPDWSGVGPLRTDIGQLADPVGYANGLALLAVLGLLLALGGALAGPARLRPAAAAALVPLAAVLVLQQSTGALAALGAALAALLLVRERPLAVALRIGALGALPLAGAIAVATQSLVVSPPTADLTAAAHAGHALLVALSLLTVLQAAGAALVRLPGIEGPRLPGRVAAAAAALLAVGVLAAAPLALHGHERSDYWSVAIRDVRSNPVLGSGAGTYVVWWLRHRSVPRSTEEAHSLYLETLAELGPVGLLLLLLALGVPLLAAFRLRGTAYGPPLFAVLVAYDVGAAVDFDWELAAVTVPAILVGASAAVHASTQGRPVRLATALGFATLAAAGVLALAGNAPLAAAQDELAAGRFAAAASDASRALRYAPFSADAWQALGDARALQGDRSGAADAYRSAIAHDRNDWNAWLALAAVTSGEPRRTALAQAARLNPLGGSR